MNAPLAFARSHSTPPRPARAGAGVDAAACALAAPTPEPAAPLAACARPAGPARPTLAALQSRVSAALGTEAFPAVLLAVLQQAYPAGPVALRWGNDGAASASAPSPHAAETESAGEVSGLHPLPPPSSCAPAPAPWLETGDVALWLPEGAGDDDLRGWLLALIAAQQELTRAHARTDFLTRLVSVLAHEVRNPLTVVMGALELTTGDERMPAPLRATLAAARRTAARIESVTRAATEMARAAAAGADLPPLAADHFSLKQALARAAG